MHQLLKTHFGYDQFRPLQKDIIDNVIARKDTLVLMPTGGGKSICYQLPAIRLGGLTLVISPLIALMKDQVDALKINGVRAEFINSSISTGDIMAIQEEVKRGEVNLLYVSPERLAQASFKSFLTQLDIQLIAIDEAHCISDWGHDFRPDYRNLKQLKTLLPEVPIIALTATATPKVADDIVEQLGLKDCKRFVASFDRPNLKFVVRDKKLVLRQILELVERHKGESVIIYCFSRKNTEKVASDLANSGYKALPYHAGLDPEVRKTTQEKFIRDEVNIIVATIAFGMGIDKPDIRLIIHHTFPKSIESYYQEIGRAGRDGLPGEGVMFFGWHDKFRHQFFIDKIEDPAYRQITEAKMKQVIDYCQQGSCRRSFLLDYFGEKSKVANCGNCDNCVPEKETFKALALRNMAPDGPYDPANLERGLDQHDPEYKHLMRKHEEKMRLDYFQKLFHELRTLRRSLAEREGVAPYVIFHDSTLYEMAYYLPANTEELSKIEGVGSRKLEKYGVLFLERVLEFQEQSDKPSKPVPTRQTRRSKRIRKEVGLAGTKYHLTKSMVDEKKSLEEIAQRHDIQEQAAYVQIERIIDAGERLDLSYLSPPKANFEAIEIGFKQCGEEKLKPVYEFLKEEHSYDDIRMVRLINRAGKLPKG